MSSRPWTQLPNEFIEMMHEYKPSVLSVFVAICRKTIGWHKEVDVIALSQIEEMTGLSRPVVIAAIKTLERDTWITVIRTEGYPNVYDINPDRVGSKESLQGGSKDSYTGVVEESLPLPVKNLYPQKKGLKKDKEKKKGVPKTLLLDDVRLTNEEYVKLCSRTDKPTVDRAIELLNVYKMSSGHKYKSDYFAIIKWAEERAAEELKNEQPKRGQPFFERDRR